MTTRASLPSQGGFVIHAQELQEAQELREAHSCSYAYSWRFENGRRMCMDKQTEGGRLQTLGHCTNPTRSKGRAVKTTTLIPHEARVLGRHHLRLADVVTWDLEISIKHGGRGSGKALHGSESGFQGLLAFATQRWHQGWKWPYDLTGVFCSCLAPERVTPKLNSCPSENSHNQVPFHGRQPCTSVSPAARTPS